jgi:hypothetical protein
VPDLFAFTYDTMSIRNATIARRKRRIGLSEQEERMASLRDQLRRLAGTRDKKKNLSDCPERHRKAPMRQASWADW